MYETLTMTEAEKDAISSDDLHTGLLVFCTDTNKLYIYNNDAWVSVTLSQIMSITTEQAVINKFYPEDNTKTISDIVTELNKIYINDSQSIEVLKESFPDVSDWSI